MGSVRRALVALVVLGAAFSTGPAPDAAASLVFTEEVSFEDVVRPAAAVVLVELADPAQVHVEIPIPGRPDKGCGTYQYGVWRARVVKLVDGTGDRAPPAPGQRLTIFLANTADLIRISQDACLEGISESPIFADYDGEEPKAGAQLLVPLRWQPPYGWVETVAGAWLPPAAEERVRAVRKAERRPAAGDRDAALADILCVSDDDCTVAVTDCGPCGTCPDTPGRALHVETLRRFTAICAAERAKERAVPPGQPRPQPPACEPCRTSEAPPAPQHAVCRAMRCVLAPPQ